MFEKIKEFFEKKPVKITEGIVIAVAAAGLYFGGVDITTEVPAIAKGVLVAVTAVEALITIIQGIVTKSNSSK